MDKALDKQSPQARRARTTIRYQLLVAVNLVLAVLVTLFFLYDYRRELASRLTDKRIALDEEAKTLLPAALHMRDYGRESVQQYVDDVCGQMQDADSPGHHIVIQFGDDTFQASAHHRASREILLAMQQAAESPSRRSEFGQSELVVGTYEQSDGTVYVSEEMKTLYHSVIGDVLRRLGGFLVLALVAVIVVNLVLARVVTRPLDQLVTTVQKIGEGRLGVQSSSFRSAELDYLAGEINAMSESLAAADRDRKTQMAKAREIQQNLLPKGIRIPGLKIAYFFEPTDDVGGDYYDTLPLNDGTWLFCVADVTGHGVPAAMTAAILKALLMQATESLTTPAKILHFINHRLIAINLSGEFVTMFLARVSHVEGRIWYASAGHEPAWLRAADGKMQPLDSTGLILGVKEDATWDDATIEFAASDRLLMVTDGASETYNTEGQIFGRKRLGELFDENAQYPLEQTASRMNDLLAIFRGDARQQDDVTVVLVEFAKDAT